MCRPAVFRRPDECLLCGLTSAMLQKRVGTASAMLFTSDRKMSFAKLATLVFMFFLFPFAMLTAIMDNSRRKDDDVPDHEPRPRGVPPPLPPH